MREEAVLVAWMALLRKSEPTAICGDPLDL